MKIYNFRFIMKPVNSSIFVYIFEAWRPVKTGFLSVFQFSGLWWTRDQDRSWSLISLHNFWSLSVLVQSSLGFFPVL
jgi:hypothetical protein